jgi:hypothetical protein
MATYRLFDKAGKIISHHDLQDKAVWCRDGMRIEEVFVDMYGGTLNVDINPTKLFDPYSPDLIELSSGFLADLKTQNTPFFKSEELYGINPSHAVVFNHKDRVRYNEKYPDLFVYYWVEWVAVSFEMGGRRISVNPLYGVWRINMRVLDKILEESDLHQYQQRIFDRRGNAKSSYVIDIMDKRFDRLI